MCMCEGERDQGGKLQVHIQLEKIIRQLNCKHNLGDVIYLV